MEEDTISAISTPLGEGGIGIVRLSGPQSTAIARKIFQAKRAGAWWEGRGHVLVYGHVIDQADGKQVDEALLGYMRSPLTYTREDIVELNCHGGIVPLRRTLELALAAGARLAEPGEFTKRAFINGRIDLAQAESVIDIIRAKTEKGLKVAAAQLKGELSQKIGKLQDEVLGLLAQIEANIDFPEDDLEDITGRNIEDRALKLAAELDTLIRNAEAGKIYREGIWTIIAGRPNVGKSSLLNRLLRENRAIVTEVPGTTRDIIEEVINIRGIPLKLVDTAGIRETGEKVERLGVERTKEMIGRADLVLLVLDSTAGITGGDREIAGLVKDKETIVLINKIDLKSDGIGIEEAQGLACGRPVLRISAVEGYGLDALEEKIVDMALGGRVSPSDEIMVTNVRHKRALEKSREYLLEARAAIRGNVPVDIVSIDVKAAWEALGEITGSTITEEIVDRIFADFCVGK